MSTKKSKNNKKEILESKRFIIRKSLIGKGIVVQFTDYDGRVHK